MNCWEGSVSGTESKWLAVEGDFSGYYKTYPLDLSGLGFGTLNIDVKDFAFLAGPRINFHPVFVHALVGVDHLSGSALGYSASQSSFAGAFGGGFQVPVSPRWGIRVSADYGLTNQHFSASRELVTRKIITELRLASPSRSVTASGGALARQVEKCRR